MPGIAQRKLGVEALHREVWKAANGPIPEGNHIHHVDFDALNNDLSNLVCVTEAEHHALHDFSGARQRYLRSPVHREHLKKASAKAADWHRSPEGRAWHSANAVASNAKRALLSATCEQCGEQFESKEPKRFCSNKCRAASRRESGLDNEQRTCQFCQSPFTVNRYAKKNYCSRSCASKAGRALTT